MAAPAGRPRRPIPTQLEKALPEQGVSLRSLVARTRNSWHARKGEYDFSHEVKEAMSGCLACKACSTQCPIKIDVPEFRSRFLQLYHSRYLRPVRDHLVALGRILCAADGAGAEDF
ncbi:(Fe-S)-binding protein [Klebsiella variicola subsp. variicola]|nr:(Fe-S)-binding protein [Klebsiella variicola subsp. variicola]